MFRMLGASWVTGTFILAWMFPNMLRRLMGEGALSAAFIPAFVSSREREGPAAAKRLLSSVSGTLLLALSTLTVIVLVLCAVLPPELVGSPDNRVTATESGAMLLRFSAILFPYAILICLAAIYNGALNSLSIFAIPAAVPAILNVVWIAALLLGIRVFGEDKVAIFTFLAGSLLLAGTLQFAGPAAVLQAKGYLARPRLPRPGDPARRVFVTMAPTALAMSMLQLNTLVDQGIAYFVIAPEAISHVYNANRLISFPFALTSLALATAVFPRFAELASREKLSVLEEKVGGAQRLTLFSSVPASLGLILIAHDFIELFYGSDKFGSSDVALSAQATACLVVGLPFLSAAQLYSRALFALGNTRAPAMIAATLVPTNLILNLIFVLALGLGVAGLTLATAACAALDMLLLRHCFHRQCEAKPMRQRMPLVRVAAASAAMGLMVWWARGWFAVDSKLEIALFRLALPIGLGMLSYGAFHWLTGGHELRRLLRRR